MHGSTCNPGCARPCLSPIPPSLGHRWRRTGFTGHACGDYCGWGFTVTAPRARVMLRAKAGVQPMPLQPQMEVHGPNINPDSAQLPAPVGSAILARRAQ
jgi:hypothetical protein